ncbi:MAG: hypothetical protein D6E12_00935 [Desulfovibrio sp.]|nr:MAG: hypothetical protein D6E12_00935 [Desulfovibrio sp.]
MTQAEGGEQAGRFKGVFSTVKATYIGEGATRRKVMNESYYYVEEMGEGMCSVQALSDKFVPTGPVEEVEREIIESRYVPEPSVYSQKMIPAVKELTKTLAKAERLRKQGNPFTAEFEYSNALKIDETNIRATFGLGLSLLDRGESEKADTVFKQLVQLEDTFHTDNANLFNEFGINLRKNKMFDQALEYYEQAYKISPLDEHLLFNMARTSFEMEDFTRAADYTDKALDIRGDFSEALELQALIDKKLAKLKK